VDDYHSDNSYKDCTESPSSSPPLLKDKKEAFSFSDIVHKFIEVVKSNSEKKTEKSEEKTKMILKGISLYFNPGQLIAIMGPSGMYTKWIDIRKVNIIVGICSISQVY